MREQQETGLNTMEKRAKGIIFSIFIFTILSGLLGPMEMLAQNPMDMMYGMQGSQEQEVREAASHIEKVLEMVLERVADLKSLTAQDVEDIKLELEDSRRYFVKFEPEQKASVTLIEAFLAHFSGDRQEALSLIAKALKAAPDNENISDSAIVLGLLYEDYELVRPILAKRCPVVEQEEEEEDELEEEAEGEDLEMSEPNAVGRSGTKAREESAQAERAQRRSSVWSRSTGETDSAAEDSRKTSARKPATRKRKESTAAAANPMMYMMGMGTSKTVLKLPVLAMPGENLGQDFQRVILRNLNGSYFYFEPGQGQILCALLWSTGKKTGSRTMNPNDYIQQMMSGMAKSRPRDQEKVIPKPEFDLKGNASQFGDLFTEMVLSGKVGFLSVNQDTIKDPGKLADIVMEGSWPWSSCVASDPVNQSQWNLTSRVAPVMMMVDTKGKVRYVGPVGGFLPQMLLQAELAQAKAGAGVPSLAALGDLKLGAGQNMEALMKQAMEKLGGESAGELPKADPNDLLEEPNTAESETAAAAAPPAVSTGTAGKKSDPFARQLMDVAKVQKKLTPRKAMETYRSVIEKYPNSLEAEEAKINIEQLKKRYGKRVE